MTAEPETLTADPSLIDAPSITTTLDPVFVAHMDALPSTEELQRLEIERLKTELSGKTARLDALAELAREHETCQSMEEAAKAEVKKWKNEADSLAVSMVAAALGKSTKDEVGQERLIDNDGLLVEPVKSDLTPAQSVANRIANGDVLEVADLDWTAVHKSALSELMSTGKPAKVKPVEIMGAQHVLVDVQNRVAVLYSLFDDESFQEKHGIPGAIRPDERSEALKQFGDYCGLPVKVGRKGWWLGADPLLVRIPSDAAISTSEPLAGPGSDIVANRIYAHLDASPVEYMTIDALSKLLGIELDVTRQSVMDDSRLIYETRDGVDRASKA